MGISSGPPIFLLIISGAAFLTGLWLLWRGWRGRRVGDSPFCAKCGYSLVGRASDRCPECGADVSNPSGVAYGQRVRSGRSAGVGALVAIMAALFLVAVSSDSIGNLNWYRLKPTAFVLDDLARSNSPDRLRAWRELDQRLQGGSALSARHHDRLAEIALAEQGGASTNAPAADLVEWLASEALAGRLSETQKKRFYDQMVRLTLTVRPNVIEGDDAPYRISDTSRGPAGDRVRWWNRIEQVSASIDGGLPRTLGGSGTTSGLGSSGATAATVPVKGIGRHELKVTLRVETWNGPDFGDNASPRNTLQNRRDITLTAPLEVVPVASGYGIKHPPPDAGTEARLRAAITPKDFQIGPGPRPSLSGVLKLQSIPVDIAFAASARVSGKEYQLGTINLLAGGTTDYHVSGSFDGPTNVASFDLILRPDESAARRTVDITRMWDGALEFKDVPIKMAGK
jgi:hypothetical protein